MKSRSGGLILDKLRAAVEAGSTKEVTQYLHDVHPEEPTVLCARLDDAIRFKRPSTGARLEVPQPSLLMVAVTGWFPDVVNLLVRAGADVNDSCELIDYCDGVEDEDIPKNPVEVLSVTPLMLAAITGRLEHANILLDNGAMVNAQDSTGETALIKALQEENPSVIDLLVNVGCNIELQTAKGVTPLMHCARGGHVNSLIILLKLGVNVHKQDQNKRNALFYALESPTRSREIFKRLLNSGCTGGVDQWGVSMLMRAADLGDLEMVTYFLEQAENTRWDPLINAVDCKGRNALFHACTGGYLPVVQHLINKTGVLATPDNDGVTVIMETAGLYHTDLVHFLVSHCKHLNVSPLARDKNGRNALFYAAEAGSLELFSFLMDKGKVQLQKDNFGHTVLMHAVEHGSAALVHYILNNMNKNEFSKFLSIDDVDDFGRNILFPAVKLGNIDLFNTLYSAGAVPCVDKQQINLLMASCAAGHSKMTGFLFENRFTLGIDLVNAETGASIKDTAGHNILFYCVDGEQAIILDFFLNHVKPESAASGKTLLMHAAECGQANIVQKLLDLPEIDLNAVDDAGQNALFHSVFSRSTAILQLLLQRRLKPVANRDGVSLLMLAAKATSTMPVLLSECKLTRTNQSTQLTSIDIQHKAQDILCFLLEHANRLHIDVHAVDKYGRNALFYAVESNNEMSLGALKQAGLKPVTTINGETLFMTAASTCNEKMTKQLMAFYDPADRFVWDWNAQNIETGEDIYFIAFRSENYDLVDELLKHKNPVAISIHNNASNQSLLALCYATHQSKLVFSILNYLNSYATDEILQILNGHDGKGMTSFHYFVTTQDLTSLQKWYECFDVADNGSSLLLHALKVNTTSEILECILHLYPTSLLSSIENISGFSPLHLAILSDNYYHLKALLSCGLRITLIDFNQSSVLHHALKSKSIFIFRHLVRFYWSDVKLILSQINNQNRSIIHVICEEGLIEFCKILFHCAVEQREVDVLRLAFEQTTNIDNQSTLMLAAVSNNVKLFELPLFQQLCLNNMKVLQIRDSNGKTALHYTCQKNVLGETSLSMIVVNHLIKAGLQADEKDNHGHTPLMAAAGQSSCLTLLKALLNLKQSHGEQSQQMMAQEKSSEHPMESAMEMGRNSFDYCADGNSEIMKVYVEKEFGLSIPDESFLETMLDYDPSSLALEELLTCLADRELIISRYNVVHVLSLMPNKRQQWAQLVHYVSKRGRGRLAELCSLISVYDSKLAEQLKDTLSSQESVPDEF